MNQTSINKLLWVTVIAVAVAAGVVGNWWLQGRTQAPATATSEVLTTPTITGNDSYSAFGPARSIAAFELQEANSNGLTNNDLLDKWSFIILGYTYCPDVCPTTLARVKAVYKQLKQTADVQVIFVSVDPLRDGIERLGTYTGYFEPEFRAVTANHDKLFPFAQSLLLPYGIIAQAPSDDYAVSHSTAIALINPQGNLQGQFKPVYQAGLLPVVDMKKMARQFNEIVAKISQD